MTKKQVQQFNKMFFALKMIVEEYQTPGELLKASEVDFGLSYEEVIEMAYENIKAEAFEAIQGIEAIEER